jgi:hypothetical protein
MNAIQKQLSLLLTAGLLLGTIAQSAALANTPRPAAPQGKNLTIKSGLARQGLPGRRTGGGARDCVGACVLAAITPEKGQVLTLAAKPRFLFYLPANLLTQGQSVGQLGQADRTVEFILRDGQGQIVYDSTFTVSANAGFLDLDLAQQQMTTSLRPNEDYRWQFSLIPNAKNRSQDIDVIGVVRRVLPQTLSASQTALLKQSPSLAQANLYQQLGLWQDSVSTLVSLVKSGPGKTRAIAQLQGLIKAEGIEFKDLASQPVNLIPSRPISIASGEALPEVR